jgi:hypothetical protein
MRRTALIVMTLLALSSLGACSKCDVPTWGFGGGVPGVCGDKAGR